MNTENPSGLNDVLYILGDGSVYNDKEIRYSIRSLCEHCEFDRLFIIGRQPPRIEPDVFIAADDPYHVKVQNAFHKIKIACKSDISDEFILMNDDFILFRPIENAHYYHGTIEQEVFRRSDTPSRYWNGMKRSLKLFPDGLNFEVHYPYPIRKKEWLSVMKPYRDLVMEEGALIRNLYCNSVDATRKELTEDCKLYRMPISDSDFKRLEKQDMISLSDESMYVKTLQWLDKLYPNRSKYEK